MCHQCTSTFSQYLAITDPSKYLTGPHRTSESVAGTVDELFTQHMSQGQMPAISATITFIQSIHYILPETKCSLQPRARPLLISGYYRRTTDSLAYVVSLQLRIATTILYYYTILYYTIGYYCKVVSYNYR